MCTNQWNEWWNKFLILEASIHVFCLVKHVLRQGTCRNCGWNVLAEGRSQTQKCQCHHLPHLHLHHSLHSPRSRTQVYSPRVAGMAMNNMKDHILIILVFFVFLFTYYLFKYSHIICALHRYHKKRLWNWLHSTLMITFHISGKSLGWYTTTPTRAEEAHLCDEIVPDA